MRRMTGKIAAAAIVAAAVMGGVGAGTASADSVTVKFVGFTGKAFNYSYKGTNYSNIAAGYYNWRYVLPGNQLGDSFSTFCIELDQQISHGQIYTYDIVDLSTAPNSDVNAPYTGSTEGMGATKAELLGKLYDARFATIGNDNHKAAAFQAAVWEIVHDTGLNMLAGTFKANNNTGANGFATLAQSWLNDLSANLSSYEATNLNAMTSPIRQDQMLLVPVVDEPDSPAPVPLPPAALGGLALLGVVGVRKLASRAKSAA